MKNKGNHHKSVSKKANNLKVSPSLQHAQEGQAPQAPKPGTNAKNQFR
jgi:hypothetical protein